MSPRKDETQIGEVELTRTALVWLRQGDGKASFEGLLALGEDVRMFGEGSCLERVPLS